MAEMTFGIGAVVAAGALCLILGLYIADDTGKYSITRAIRKGVDNLLARD